MERDGRNWRKSLSDEDILKETFESAHLLQTNSNPILDSARDLLLSDYLVKAKFTYKGFNGDWLYCNGRVLAYRNKKGSPVKFTNNVKLIEGTPVKSSGSNRYPTARFSEGFCVLEFLSNGLPFVNRTNGWDIEVIEMKKI